MFCFNYCFIQDYVQVYCCYFGSNDNHIQGVEDQSPDESEKGRNYEKGVIVLTDLIVPSLVYGLWECGNGHKSHSTNKQVITFGWVLIFFRDHWKVWNDWQQLVWWR